MTDQKPKRQSQSIEQNISTNYVPKSKLNNLPISNQPPKPTKEQAAIQQDIQTFKTKFLEQNKKTISIGIIPQQATKKIEEEYEIPKEDVERELIHIVAIIPEGQYKNIGKIKLATIKLASSINNKLWIHILTPVDFWNLGLDSKFEIIEALSMSYPLHDKSFLSHIRAVQIHKSLVLKKFEKYVTSYVIYGSLTRGDAKKTSDVDVSVIIDDTDVKRMPRMELKEKLRGIIYSYIPEAESLAGVKQNTINIQVWLMTEFWEAVKDANPVMFTFIRDGIPLYDRGTFLPWKSLLRMGKIKPSSEAIDMFMSSGNKLKDSVNRRIFDAATLDLFWGTLTPTQGLLMLLGLAPPTPKETVRIFREELVKKEKLIEPEYAEILEEIIIKTWKAYEHGKLKPGDINGKRLDELFQKATKYIDRLKELREQIESRNQEKAIQKIYNDIFEMLSNILHKKSEPTILKEFESQLIKSGRLPPRFLKNLKFIAQTKKTVANRKQQNKKKKKQELTLSQTQRVDQARKFATEITNALIEQTQRHELSKVEKFRFKIANSDPQIEVFFLNSTFVIQQNKIQKLHQDSLLDSTPKELEEQISKQKNNAITIRMKDIGTLKKIFGEFDLTQ